MKKYWYYIFLLIVMSGCYEDLPELDPSANLLQNEDIPLFQVDSFSVLSDFPEVFVRIYYSTRYFELSEEQQSNIRWIYAVKNNSFRQIFTTNQLKEDTILFFDDTVEGEIVCYDFLFANSSGFSRRTESCFEL